MKRLQQHPFAALYFLGMGFLFGAWAGIRMEAAIMTVSPGPNALIAMNEEQVADWAGRPNPPFVRHKRRQ
jgi:hypothetical protein